MSETVDQRPTTLAARNLEELVAEWRGYMRRRRAIHPADVEELEDHLRSQVDSLLEAGLADDEAFLVAVKRMGAQDELSREFAREYSERLWKQLVISPAAADTDGASDATETAVAIALACAAGMAVKLLVLVGIESWLENEAFFVRNLSLCVLPFLAAYFVWKRRIDRPNRLRLGLMFVAGLLFANIYPFSASGMSHTEALTSIHLPIALWMVVGLAYAGGRWRDHERRMDFVRFSGEWFIYYALIALGGGVLMGFIAFAFSAIGIRPDELLGAWILPVGAAGAVIVSAWLVEAKQSVVENMAPVLTRLFTPLFVAVLLAFLGTMLWTGSGIEVDREVLIGFDLLLVVILGLLLYAVSARDPQAPPGLFDGLQLALVICALIVDALALTAISARISEFGFSPNKVAALGLNLILLVNLAVSAVLYARFLRGRGSFAALERWQTAYLPVYGIWAAIVVILFPPLFGFR